MNIQENKIEVEEITDKNVINYLRTNPDFFLDNTSLLANLEVPHPVNGAISLIEHQVRVLRAKNAKLNQKLKEMIGNARINDKLNERMFHLAGALIRVTNLEDTLMVIEESMYDDFEADAVAIKLYDPDMKLPISHNQSLLIQNEAILSSFGKVIKSRKPYCGSLKNLQLEFLFGKKGKKILSNALLPVGHKFEYGFVAIGSQDRKRFHQSKDTSFLAHLSELLGSALQGKI
ncbi:hypothetical protein MNBD_GAMMA12-416 [hydrothermal vent metagenome]|uniref:DUF484 family protein n=1 Tax=hydrothermal vent metagenome TaxID=652676 RepID=A0A3B0YE53_9ZZZZ